MEETPKKSRPILIPKNYENDESSKLFNELLNISSRIQKLIDTSEEKESEEYRREYYNILIELENIVLNN